jgi:hypothetical protein
MRRFSDLQGEAAVLALSCRVVAEFSTALGTAGRWFESSCPDHSADVRDAFKVDTLRPPNEIRCAG